MANLAYVHPRMLKPSTVSLSNFRLRIAYEKYEYGYLSSWYIKSTIYKKLKLNFQTGKVFIGKTPFFVIGPFCVPIRFAS